MSFNDMAFKGGEDAEEAFGIEMVELVSITEADYVPNLRTAAADPDVKLIVGVGFLLTHALIEVAKEYPNKAFAGIDTFTKWVEPQPNLLDIVYEEHKGSALVGALGGLLAAYHSTGDELGADYFPHIGGVFGIEIPVLWKFEIGYKWGCDWAMSWIEANKPEMKRGIYNTPKKERVLWTYTGTFSDITKGYLAATPMYEKGAVAVYNIAGPLGLGINSALRDRMLARVGGVIAKLPPTGPPFWIGVDANQDWVNPGYCIASMMKRVDYGLYYGTKWVKDGIFFDIVDEYDHAVVLGIGTLVRGEVMEGISVSTLADLDEFVKMGERAEEVTGSPVLPGPRDWIYARVREMRGAQPGWIWDAVAELESKIRTGEVEVPMVVTEDDIAYWRGILG